MIAKSIIKLIDEAIMPALTLIFAKMLGLYLSVYFFDLTTDIKARQVFGFLPAVHFENPIEYAVAENYSNLSMFIVAAAGTLLVLIRAHYFHQSHIHPKLQAKLARLNLESLISSSYHLYHQAVIWLVFLWLTVGFLVLSSVLGITYPVIAIIAFVVSVNFSWVLAVDIESEILISRSSQG